MRVRLAAALALVALALGALAFAPAASAHHGWSGYDSQNTLTLTGTLARVVYGNPHVQVDLAVSGKTWAVVLAPPSRMQSRGLPEGSLKAGETVTVIGYAHKTETNELRAERIVVAGRTVELR